MITFSQQVDRLSRSVCLFRCKSRAKGWSLLNTSVTSEQSHETQTNNQQKKSWKLFWTVRVTAWRHFKKYFPISSLLTTTENVSIVLNNCTPGIPNINITVISQVVLRLLANMHKLVWNNRNTFLYSHLIIIFQSIIVSNTLEPEGNHGWLTMTNIIQ